jgi:hypothetical protein
VDQATVGLRAREGRPPDTRTRVDRDDQTLRTSMNTVFHDSGISTTRRTAAA